MILIDWNNISSIRYSTAIKEVLEDKKKRYKKTGFVDIDKKDLTTIKKAYYNLIIDELLSIKQKFFKNYGELAICVDYDKSRYWRKQIDPLYKKNRDEKKMNEFDSMSMSNFTKDVHSLLSILEKIGIKILHKIECQYNGTTVTLEADDTVSILSQKINEKNLIVSNDGDYKQMYLYSPNVKIYNPILKKIVEVNKKEIHQLSIITCLIGQAKDNIKNIKFRTRISENFIKWMNIKYQIEITQDMTSTLIDNYSEFIDEFVLYLDKVDRENVANGKYKRLKKLDSFEKESFGEKTAIKLLESSSLSDILDQNPLYRRNFEKNEKLYKLDLETLPDSIIEATMDEYNSLNPIRDNYGASKELMAIGCDFSVINKF